MAIDYVLAAGCEPQRRLGVERLVELHRTRILARSMLARTQEEGGPPKRPSDIGIQLTMRTPGGDRERGVTLQDLIDQAAPLDTVSQHCSSCPAGLTREFACHRRIRYPIPERIEHWLMARLPRSLACTAGIQLVRELGEGRWTGADAAKLRAAQTTFFESRTPLGMRWEVEGEKLELSSDQLFQMLFLVRSLTPTHCLMMALFLGVLPHDTSLHALQDPQARQAALAAATVEAQADPEIEQVAAFLRALAIAARLDVKILTDS